MKVSSVFQTALPLTLKETFGLEDLCGIFVRLKLSRHEESILRFGCHMLGSSLALN